MVLFSNCSKGDTPVKKSTPEEPIQKEPEEIGTDPEPIVYFTISIDNSIDTSEENNWVILHDSNGNLLDYRSYESGETLEFEALESEITDKINVSLFKNAKQGLFTTTGEICEGETNNGITYPNIGKGSHWTQGKYDDRLDNGPAPEMLGQYKLALINIPGGYNFINDIVYGGFGTGNISTVRFPEPGSTASSIIENDGTKTITKGGIRNFKDSAYLMTVLSENLDFKYLFFQNPEIGTDITLDYNDFLSFDSYDYLPVFPANNGYRLNMVGFENETSFKSDSGFVLLNLINANVWDDHIPLGYLNRFTHYKTSLTMYMDNFTYQYDRFGTKPAISSIPEEPVISYTNNHLDGFDMDVNLEYVRRSDMWRIAEITSENCSKTTWVVECDQQNYPSIKELPEELFTLYPTLEKLSDLRYLTTTYYLQSETYPEFIVKEFDPNHDHIITSGYTQEYIRMSSE